MNQALSLRQRALKRSFDLLLSLLLLALLGWIILLAWMAASIDTRGNGLFRQVRIGRWGRPFTIFKLKTMRPVPGLTTTATPRGDRRITPLGGWLRRARLDELPQLFNVLRGDMSFVGPRPDVPGFADRLEGGDRLILSVRPGITGPATLAFRNEEELLARVEDPEAHSRRVIYPAKVALNLDYVKGYSFLLDLKCLLATLFVRPIPMGRGLPRPSTKLME